MGDANDKTAQELFLFYVLSYYYVSSVQYANILLTKSQSKTTKNAVSCRV